MALNKLTDRKVAAFKGPGRIGDGGGLWLTAQASGAKQWTLRYTFAGKRREMGLGSYPIVPLADGREKALEARRLAKSGIDPILDRKQTAEIMSFAEAAREVHRINLPTWRNKKHADQFISTLETYAIPVFGDLSCTEIQPSHILEALQPIWLEKEETARRTKQRIGKVMEWCMAQGWRKDNPVVAASAGLPKQAKKVKQRKSLHHAEMRAVLAAVGGSEAAPRTKLAFECLVLTGVRSQEIRGAVWSEFNFEAGVWVIPAERMKMEREHRVPISGSVMELLEQARAESDGSDLVFAGSKFGKPMSDATLLKLVREQGFDVDIHGFRSTFKTWAMEETNVDKDAIEMSLSHSIGTAVEQAYVRTDLLERRRALMEAWAGYCGEKEAEK